MAAQCMDWSLALRLTSDARAGSAIT
jgi:hypothetical protein